MKAEHRKELETNVLAAQLGRAIEGFKQGPSRTTLFYIGGAVAIVAIVLLFRYFMSSSESATSQRWMELDEAVFPEQYSPFLEGDLKDTPQGRLARFKDARYELAQGLLILGQDPADAQTHLDKATTTYEDLAKSVGRVPLLHQEALAGAGKGYEALGDIDKARTFYKRLADEHPKSALGKEAAKSLERLDDKAHQADLAEMKKAFSPTRGGKIE